MNMRIHFKILGGFWLLIGGVVTVGLVVGLWQMWRTQNLPAAEILRFFVFSFALNGVAIINGWGLLSRKRWARMATIILSSILLFTSLSSLLVEMDGVGVLLMILLSIIGLYGLWLMLSMRGKEAFGVYVS